MAPLRRLALPLGLSLALHALFLAAMYLAPPPSGEVTPSTAPSGPLLSLAAKFDGPRQRPRPRPAPQDPGIPVDVEVKMLTPPLPADASLRKPSLAGVGVPGGSEQPPGGGAGAKAGPAPLLAAAGAARRVVYVLDRSMSMGHTGALARARREVITAVRQLPADARFQIIVYSHFAHHLLPGDWLSPTADTLRAVERSLADLTAVGSTDHVAALRKALSLRPDLVFLVTDADDLRPADVPAVTRINTGRAAIHVVELSRGTGDRPDGPLTQLARHNAGSHRRVCPDY